MLSNRSHQTPVYSFILLFLAVLLISSFSAQAQEQSIAEVSLAGDLPEYRADVREQSSLSSIGSDSMGGLMTKWVLAYRKYQPKVRLQVVSRGSALAPAALVEGTADLGPMARPMKTSERKDFLSRYGFEPTQIRAAASVAAIYVHKDNPLQSISVRQLEQIFAANPKRGGAKIRRWKQVEAGKSFPSEQINLLGRATDSYLAGYFKQRVLLQGEFSSSMKQLSSSSDLFDEILAAPGSIGFSEFQLSPPKGIRMLKVMSDEDGKAFLPTRDTIADGTYPLSRYLSIYLVRSPGEPVDEATADFLRFVLSRQGQQLVEELGMRPLTADVLREERDKLL